MPTLKDLKCTIELSDSEKPLQEFGTTYGDGFVETFVPVPSKPQSFSIHLTSDKFIAPGISMFVFVDGVYQCNRNKQNLKLRKSSDRRSVVDFRVRQKEEKQKDGSMIAREWKFEKLNTTSADGAPDIGSTNVVDNIGCIEVLVLRCAGPRSAKTIPGMNLDGADDLPPQPFGFDGHSMYDDRGPFFSSNTGNHRPPPPLPSYRSPYAESAQSHDTRNFNYRNTPITVFNENPPFAPSGYNQPRSRYSDAVSPGARAPSSVPSAAFQYGSGPIPPGPMMNSKKSLFFPRSASAVVANAPGVDPAWLDEIVTKAVKRGVEESRQEASAPEIYRQNMEDLKSVSQPPGAWPQSPYIAVEQPAQSRDQEYYNTEEESGATWGSVGGQWDEDQVKSRAKAQVNWKQESEWDSQTNTGGWSTRDDTASDTWDTDETWETKKPERGKRSRRNTPRASTSRNKFDNTSPPDTPRTHTSPPSPSSPRPHNSRSNSRPATSKWNERRPSSPEDYDGWTQITSTPVSLASLHIAEDPSQQTRRPSHAPSSKKPNKRSKKSSHRTQSAHNSESKPQRHSQDKSIDTLFKSRNAVSENPSSLPIPSRAKYPPEKTSQLHPALTPLAKNPHPSALSSWNWAAALDDAFHKQGFAAPSAVSHIAPYMSGDVAWDTADSDKVWKYSGRVNTSMTNCRKKSRERSSDAWLWGKGKEEEEGKGWSDMNAEMNSDSANDGNGNANVNDEKNPKKNPKNKTKTKTKTKTKPTLKNKNTWPLTPPTKTLNHNPIKPKHNPSLPQQHTPHRFPTLRNSLWKFPPPISHTTAKLIPSPSPSPSPANSQIHLSPATPYGHAIARPEYIDTLEKPYAVFRFKYRSRGVLKDMFEEGGGGEEEGARGWTEEWVRRQGGEG